MSFYPVTIPKSQILSLQLHDTKTGEQRKTGNCVIWEAGILQYSVFTG